MDFSAWHPVKSDGTLPDAVAGATLFQLRWYIEWEYTIASLTRVFDTLKGKWRWRIGSGDEVLFDQEVETETILNWFANFGVIFFSWYYDYGAEEIATHVPLKPPVLGADPARWWYDDATETWQNIAEAGTADPGGAALPDITDATARIQFWWESPVYEIPLPQGAKIAVPFHNVGAAWLIKLANVQIRTAGVGKNGAHTDLVGIHRLVVPSPDALRHSYTLDGGRNWYQRRVPFLLREPGMFKQPDNTLCVFGQLGHSGWLCYRSENDGRTWLEEATLMFEDGYTDLRAVSDRDGATVAIARKSGELWCRTSRDQFVATVRIGSAAAAFELTCHEASGRLLASDCKSVHYVSTDSGKTWAQIDAPA